MRDTYVVLFKALSSNSRIMILRVLAERGEMSVEEITKHINLAGSTVSRHLQELRMQELVTVKHDAQNRYYSLDRERLADKLGSFLKGLGIAPAVPLLQGRTSQALICAEESNGLISWEADSLAACVGNAI